MSLLDYFCLLKILNFNVELYWKSISFVNYDYKLLLIKVITYESFYYYLTNILGRIIRISSNDTIYPKKRKRIEC